MKFGCLFQIKSTDYYFSDYYIFSVQLLAFGRSMDGLCANHISVGWQLYKTKSTKCLSAGMHHGHPCMNHNPHTFTITHPKAITSAVNHSIWLISSQTNICIHCSTSTNCYPRVSLCLITKQTLVILYIRPQTKSLLLVKLSLDFQIAWTWYVCSQACFSNFTPSLSVFDGVKGRVSDESALCRFCLPYNTLLRMSDVRPWRSTSTMVEQKL